MSNNPWDVPPFPRQGDEAIERTFTAVGFALSQWEWFEGHLAMLYAALVGHTPDEGFAAVRSYGTVVSFNARRNMIREAARIHFIGYPDDDLSTSLNQLLGLADKLSARRNDIAHGIVQAYLGNNEGEYSKATGFVLMPAYHATSKRKVTPHDLPLQITSVTFIYGSVEIERFGREFGKLVDPTARLVAQITAQKDRKDRSGS